LTSQNKMAREIKKAVVRKCPKSKKYDYKIVILNRNGTLNRVHSYYKTKPAAEKVARQLNQGIKFLRG